MSEKAHSKAVSEHLAEKSEELCSIVDNVLDEMKNGSCISGAPLNQLSSALGMLVDRFADDNADDDDGELIKILKDFEEIK